MTPEGLEAYGRLFSGRTDCYGTWEGGCIHEPLTKGHYVRHLTTGPYIGVYPTIGSNCTFGCVDIDGKDHPLDAERKLWDWDHMMVIARNLQAALAMKDIQAWLERTVNGIHVWVFPDRPLIPAKHMRRALQAACQVIGYKPKEVNPKTEDAGKSIGNYVRLPYPGGFNATERRFTFHIDPDNPWSTRNPNEVFIYLDEDGRSSAAAIEAVAGLWTPPPVVTHEFDDSVVLDATLKSKLSGLSHTIWRDGALEGNDRSGTLAHLAHLLVEDGLTPSEALAVLVSADQRMGGKFTNRGDQGVAYLQDMVEKAMGKVGS